MRAPLPAPWLAPHLSCEAMTHTTVRGTDPACDWPQRHSMSAVLSNTRQARKLKP